jgi:very-short-patch-repair endonuclease
VRRTANGRYRLDVEFESGLVVEIDGAHHGLGLNPVDDALRANEVTLGGSRVLRIPVLGLRLEPARFMAQVARALGEVSGGDMRSAAPTTRSA